MFMLRSPQAPRGSPSCRTPPAKPQYAPSSPGRPLSMTEPAAAIERRARLARSRLNRFVFFIGGSILRNSVDLLLRNQRRLLKLLELQKQIIITASDRISNGLHGVSIRTSGLKQPPLGLETGNRIVHVRLCRGPPPQWSDAFGREIACRVCRDIKPFNLMLPQRAVACVMRSLHAPVCSTGLGLSPA